MYQTSLSEIVFTSFWLISNCCLVMTLNRVLWIWRNLNLQRKGHVCSKKKDNDSRVWHYFSTFSIMVKLNCEVDFAVNSNTLFRPLHSILTALNTIDSASTFVFSILKTSAAEFSKKALGDIFLSPVCTWAQQSPATTCCLLTWHGVLTLNLKCKLPRLTDTISLSSAWLSGRQQSGGHWASHLVELWCK